MDQASGINDQHEANFSEYNHAMIDMCCGPISIGSTYGPPTGLALDAIVVYPSLENAASTNDGPQRATPESKSGIVASSDFILQFPQHLYDMHAKQKVLIQINGNYLQQSVLSMSLPKEKGKDMCTFQQGHSTKPPTDILEKLVSQKLLTPGRNLIRYILVQESESGIWCDENNLQQQKQQQHQHQQENCNCASIAQAEAYVFLWSVHDTIVISDIDGTVTKSDVRGVIDTLFTESYSHIHEGVCSLFTDLVRYKREQEDVSTHANDANDANNANDGGTKDVNQWKDDKKHGEVRLLYLSSRPMRLIHSTRKFLSMVTQKKMLDSKAKSSSTRCSFMESCMGTSSSKYVPSSGTAGGNNELLEGVGHRDNLPPGPIFLHTGTLSKVLVTELVKKSTHEFKADLLARQVVLPFICAGKKGSKSQLFLAGFGNKKTDFLAYEMVGMSSQHIYIIDKNSILVSTNAGLEFEGGEDSELDDGDRESEVFSMESMAFMCPKEDISSDKISVSNPEKTTKAYASQNKRRFRGYGDPRLRRELLYRISC
jgi:hypothetical protein